MRLATFLNGPTERSTLVLRTLALCLSGLSYLLFAPSVESLVVLIWAGYLCLSGLLALRHKPLGILLASLVAAIDVGVISSLIVLAPQGAPALWPLYLFPLAAAAISGPLIVAITTALSAVSWATVVWNFYPDLYQTFAWSCAILIAIGVTVTVLSRRWAVERSLRLVWQEATLASQSLWKGDAPEEADRSVIESMVRLARARHGWLLRTGRAGAPVVAARSSRAPERAPAVEKLLASIGDGSGAVLSNGTWKEELDGAVGEAFALRSGWTLVGTAVLVWDSIPAESNPRRAALRMLASGAAETLIASDRRSSLRREAHLEAALHRMGQQMSSTLDPNVVVAVMKEGIYSGIGAVATLEREEPRQRVEGEPTLTIPIQDGDGASLVISAGESLDELDKQWLNQVAELVAGTLAKCAEYAALKAIETRLRSSLESLPAPSIVTGPDGGTTIGNRAYRALCGPSRRLPLTLSLEPGVEEEAIIGEPPRTFVVSTAPVDKEGFKISVFREVTREREALRVKDELIAMAGHELRSPLTSISGYSQMMSRQLSVVQRQIGQLDQLIGDFIEASSFDDAHLSLRMEPVNLNDVCRAAAERFAGSHPGRRLGLDISDLPEVSGDAVRLGQVLDNLLSNASKYSPREETEIVLGATKQDDHVLLWVQDHGLGIDSEHLPLLFERYYRVRSQETQGVKGLGLGLSIVRDLVEAHGGTVWAESAGAGQGSTFWIKLPTGTSQSDSTSPPVLD